MSNRVKSVPASKSTRRILPAFPSIDGHTRFILGTVLASTALNGWAGYQHGGWFGLLFMAMIPWGILQGAANAAADWNAIDRGSPKRKTKPPAITRQTKFWTMLGIVIACLGALFVSLWHIAETIQAKTGSAPWQAWFLAIVIDIGLVAHEVSKAAK